MEEIIIIYWYGLYVVLENDGGLYIFIFFNIIWNFVFIVLDKVGIYWYYFYLYEKINEYVSKGIVGMIIVWELEEVVLVLLWNYGVDDILMVL